MGIFQSSLSKQDKLFMAIMNALPNSFSEIKSQALSAQFFGFRECEYFPDFKSVTMCYSGDTMFHYKKRGMDFKITNIQIFSKKNNKYEDIEILINENLISGLKIANSSYQLKEFDICKINADNVLKVDFKFPPKNLDVFYDGLDMKIKKLLNPNDLCEIDFNNRIYYQFYALEDGNCLAVDKKLNVYSLIHDANPMAKKMKIEFFEILNDIVENKFDIVKHFEERYNS